MMTITRVRRNYKRFRVDNHYSYPALFFFVDILLGALKVLAIGFVLAIAWLIFNRYFVEQHQIDTGATIDVASQSEGVKPKPGREKATAEKNVVSMNALSAQEGNLSMVPAASETARLDTTAADEPAAASPAGTADNFSLMDHNWILGKSKLGYTVQLGSSPEKAKLVDFAKQIELDEQLHIYTFKLTPSGRPVYGLAFGVYSDFEVAEKVIEELPASLQEYQPWIRRIDTLQDQIIRLTGK